MHALLHFQKSSANCKAATSGSLRIHPDKCLLGRGCSHLTPVVLTRKNIYLCEKEAVCCFDAIGWQISSNRAPSRKSMQTSERHCRSPVRSKTFYLPVTHLVNRGRCARQTL